MKKTLFLFLVFYIVISKLDAQTNHSFLHNGVSRNFIVYVPQNINPQLEPPLLLALHGFTQNGSTIMQYSGFNDLADIHGFVVAYPYGLNTSWNVGQSGADDVGFLLALTDTLHSWHSIDLNRVYATGFSNGGFMSYRMACEASDRIAAVAAVAGTLPTAIADICQADRAIPVIHFHGTSDFIVPYAGSGSFYSVDANMQYWQMNNNCNTEAQVLNLPDLVQEGSTVQQFTWEPCEGEVYNQLLKINGGGHTWPGYDGFMGIGNANMDISASALIWEFVSQFSLTFPTSTESNKMKTLRTPYPNPLIGNKLYVPSNIFCNPIKAVLFTSGGKEIYHEKWDINKLNYIEIENLLPGVYVLHLTDCKGKTTVFRIIRI